MILVIGGRSKIGAALIGELLGRGQQVRALVRADEPAGRLPAGAEPVTGDLADEGSLVTAMAGVEKVFLPSSPHRAVRQALVGAGLTEWFADALVGLYQDCRRSGTGGYAAQVTGTIQRLTSRPARSLDDLLGEIAHTLPAT